MATQVDLARTSEEFDVVIERCSRLFYSKMGDYGAAWRILRMPSLTDQIFIKAQRIRSIEENPVKMVDEGEIPEWIGIFNYSVMALIQIEKGVVDRPDMDSDEALSLYLKYAHKSKELMMCKNHDYGEAWRDMRISSLCDIILQKILRVKQIEDNGGVTTVSEGIDANYYDMANYSAFALIKLMENGQW
jgi:hypothetical protein